MLKHRMLVYKSVQSAFLRKFSTGNSFAKQMKYALDVSLIDYVKISSSWAIKCKKMKEWRLDLLNRIYLTLKFYLT